MPLNLFYTMVQKSQKWPKTQIKGGGSCLKAGSPPPPPLELSFWLFRTFLYHVKEESQTNLLMKTAWKNSNGKLTKLSFEFDVFSIFESRNRCARWAAAQRAVIRIDQGKSRWVAVGMLKCTVMGRPTCSSYLQLDCTRLLSSGAFHPKSAITWLYLWAQVEGFVRPARSLGGPNLWKPNCWPSLLSCWSSKDPVLVHL